MTKPAAHKKHTTGRTYLSPIVKQAARVVVYITLALGIGAVVASCQSSALNQPLLKG
jgi:hypothetical protein